MTSNQQKMSTYENVGGPPQGDWARGLFSCFETMAGIKSFAMGCCWPFCGPCLYGKISARVSWPTTRLEKLGDTPFKQWFRISVPPSSCMSCHLRLFLQWRDQELTGKNLPVLFFSQLLLVLLYWFVSWGESMMASEEPHFSVIANSEAEINGFKSANDMMEHKIVRFVACFSERTQDGEAWRVNLTCVPIVLM